MATLPPHDVAVLLEAILDAKDVQELGYFGRKAFKEARDDAQRELLLQNVEMLLGERFGPLPEEATERIQRATNAQLHRMLKGVLTAGSLEAVLSVDTD